MTRRERWFVAGTSATLVVSLWLIETLLPDLLGIPAPWAWRIVGVATVAGLLVLAARSLKALRLRTPGPWLAQPVWRSSRWIRERPWVSILLAAPSATFGVSTLDDLLVHLTVHRSADRARRSTVIDFSDAVLVLTQRRQGEDRIWRLRPVETGGFLMIPLEPGRSDAAKVEFRLTALPLASAQAPDLHRPFTLRLQQVRGKLSGERPLSGVLPPSEWRSADLTP